MTHADILIVNASVLTMAVEMPRAGALAISGNRIVAVGGEADLTALRGPQTRVIDAGGGTVMPGFVEAHMHLFAGAAGRKLLQLFGVHDQDTMTRALRDYGAQNPDEGLLIAKGADYTILGDAGPLTRHHLDSAVPDRPLILIAPDHHTAWANTAALEQAGILKGRDVGPGNEIVLGDDGLATGELREGHAMAPVMALRTSGGRESLGLQGVEPVGLTPEQRAEDIETLQAGLAYCAECGITSIHNMDGNEYQLELLQEIEAGGDLLCRIELPFHMTNAKTLADLETASAMAARCRGDMISANRVKLFIDGVLDSGTAVVLGGYGDDPAHNCAPLFTPEAFNAAVAEIDRRGLQIAVHAIGDGAVRMVLDAYEQAQQANGKRDSRHRIEHIEMVHPDDIPRFAALGVIASMQPPHPPGSMGLPLEPTLSKIGRERWRTAYAWRMLKDAGARVAFASDWPVSALPVIDGIAAAMTRQTWARDLPDQRLTLDETLAAYSREGAYTGFMEAKTGQLVAGMLADVVVLSGDIKSVAHDQIHRLGVTTTICGGRVTYSAR